VRGGEGAVGTGPCGIWAAGPGRTAERGTRRG
jgi:hypothetical protein